MKYKIRRLVKNYKVFIYPLFFSVGLWLIDATVDSLIFKSDSFLNLLLSPEPIEIWFRSCILATSFVFAYQVTKNRQILNDIKENDTKFQMTFENAPTGISIVSNKGVILKANKAMCKILGYNEKELAKMTFAEITHPDDLAPNIKLRDEALKGNLNTYHMDKRYIHKKGHIVWATLSATIIRNKSGKPDYFIGQVLDITKRKQAEDIVKKNAELNKRIANTLQEALLDTPSKIKGINFDCLYKSASEATKIGGDFYDIWEIEKRKVGILIGDVSGKGLEAASLTSVVKNTIKAFSYQGETPSKILSKTNDTICKISDLGTFVTLFFGILDTGTGLLTYCGAGHPGVKLKDELNVKTLNSINPAVGIIQNYVFEETETAISPNDIMILYTDGVTEARDFNKSSCKTGFYGERRLHNVIKNMQMTGPKKIPAQILKSITDRCDLFDDVVILSIQLKPRGRSRLKVSLSHAPETESSLSLR